MNNRGHRVHLRGGLIGSRSRGCGNNRCFKRSTGVTLNPGGGFLKYRPSGLKKGRALLGALGGVFQFIEKQAYQQRRNKQ